LLCPLEANAVVVGDKAEGNVSTGGEEEATDMAGEVVTDPGAGTGTGLEGEEALGAREEQGTKRAIFNPNMTISRLSS
jgi:hypothetical protein